MEQLELWERESVPSVPLASYDESIDALYRTALHFAAKRFAQAYRSVAQSDPETESIVSLAAKIRKDDRNWYESLERGPY